MALNLIYHFRTSENQDGDFRPASYRVVYFFSEEGFLEKELLQEMAKSVPGSDFHELTFLNLDDLKAFALRVCLEVSMPEVRLLSVQDYNIGLDGAKDLTSFKGIFQKYGEKIINEAAQKKKGLFGKLFS